MIKCILANGMTNHLHSVHKQAKKTIIDSDVKYKALVDTNRMRLVFELGDVRRCRRLMVMHIYFAFLVI